MSRQKRQFGIVISLSRILVGMVMIGVVAWGWHALTNSGPAEPKSVAKDTQKPTEHTAAKPAKVTWVYNETAGDWIPSSTPPSCPSPLFTQSPVNVGMATAVLYPGQYRTRNYKPHGGFAFDGMQATDVQVVMPMDAELNGMVRYIESGEIQYKVGFITECGIAFYFDHLSALAPAFDTIAQTTPEPKIDDTRSQPFTKTYPFKAGDVIAIASGHPATNNIAIDFGVLDYRRQNAISKNPQWQALHQTYKASEWYGVCWFDLLPGGDAAMAWNLPNRDGTKSGVRSDYCDNSLGNTLGQNGGNPV